MKALSSCRVNEAMRSTIQAGRNRMADTIQQNVDALVVTIPRRVTLTDLFPGGLLSGFVFWDIATRKDGYWFALSLFTLLALAVVYAHYAGEQLVFGAESIKHRIP